MRRQERFLNAASNGYTYTPEELERIRATRLNLETLEKSRAEAKRALRLARLDTTARTAGEGYSRVRRALWAATCTRRAVREAADMYHQAVNGPVGRHLLVKHMSGFIRERLEQKSFAEQILPMESVGSRGGVARTKTWIEPWKKR